MITSSIKHHPSDDMLMAYSVGALPEAFGLMIAAHVSLCDECRARLGSYDALGGAVLSASEEPSATVSDDMLAATLAQISGVMPDPRPAPPCASPAHRVLPKPVRDYVGGDVADVKWKNLGMGVRQSILTEDGDATARLLYIPAGVSVPDHGHRGIEMTLVLQGAFSDEHDHFGVGDVETADETVDHTPVADMSEDCICLAVTDAPLRFKQFVPRLLQPIFRI